MGERRFSKKNRFVSFLLAIAMVLTLLPIGAVQAKAEEAADKLLCTSKILQIGRLFIRK